MAQYSPLEDVGQYKTIKQIQFGILSPDVIRKMAVCEVDKEILYDDRNVPVRGGPHDPDMGPVDMKQFCRYCQGTSFSCPGHFGFIDLAAPVFHMGFISTVVKVLRCVCFTCSRLRISPDDPRVTSIKRFLRPKKRLAQLSSICSKCTTCNAGLTSKDALSENPDTTDTGCGAEIPQIKLDRLSMGAREEVLGCGVENVRKRLQV
ncbi:hypothetical protein GEMRC1_002895 [Eukaryota sp. GEM-RC1]